MRRSWLVLFALFFWSRPASAQVTLTIAFVSDPSGITLSGSGTSSASLSFGTVQAFGGTVPSGVTKSVAGNSWTPSTPFHLLVQKGALDVIDFLSTSYTLTPPFQAAHIQDTLKFNSLILSTKAAPKPKSKT